MIDEIWKPIPGFNGYDVSNTGKVRSYFARDKNGNNNRGWTISDKPQRILKQSKKGKGYLFVCIKNSDGAFVPINVHILVALVFIGNRPDGMEVCHNDSDPSNNSINNLRYDSHSENLRDEVRNGNRPLSIDDVIEIRRHIKRYGGGDEVKKLSKKYNVNRYAIIAAASGKTYNVVDEIVKPMTISYIKQSRAREIRELYKTTGITMKKIGEIFGISASQVCRIVNNKCSITDKL